MDKKCTIHGKGKSIRNFIYVLDFIRGVHTVAQKGEIMKIYNIGSSNEYSVIEIARMLVKKLKLGDTLEDHIEFVEDRLFNDKRYCINTRLMREKFDWVEKISFEKGIELTIDWYRHQIPSST